MSVGTMYAQNLLATRHSLFKTRFRQDWIPNLPVSGHATESDHAKTERKDIAIGLFRSSRHGRTS